MNSTEQVTQQVNPSAFSTSRYAEDEIDLLELFAIIWQGKWIIVGITLACAAVGFIYLKLLPSIYRIEATVSDTTSYEIRKIQPAELDGGANYQVEKLEKEDVYQTALALASSVNAKRDFWELYTGQEISRFSAQEKNENQEAFESFLNHSSIDLSGLDEGSGVAVFSLESENPREAIELMASYLQFVNDKVVSILIEQLKQSYQANIERLDFDYQTLRAKELQKLDDRLLQLHEAHGLAQALGITETPYDKVENVELRVLDNREYLLGAQVLLQEIKSLEQRKEKPIEAFVTKLRNMELWKLQLKNDLKRLDTNQGKVNAFVLLSPPESSLDPVKPKKALIFIAIVFAAGLLSVVIVFILHGVKVYRARPESKSR